MDIIIALISIDVIASKFLNCYVATHRYPLYTNSITNRLLKWAKLENEVWLPFFTTVFMVSIGVYLLGTVYNSWPFQLLYVVTGLFTTTLNLGAAHSNYFGKNNFITAKLFKNSWPEQILNRSLKNVFFEASVFSRSFTSFVQASFAVHFHFKKLMSFPVGFRFIRRTL